MSDPRFRAWHRTAEEMLFEDRCGDVFRWKAEGQPVEIMQYAPVTDKHGKELCEGDIVKEHPNGKIGIVRKDMGNFVLDFGEYPDWSWSEMAYDHTDRIEIIGNIYDNPELIEER